MHYVTVQYVVSEKSFMHFLPTVVTKLSGAMYEQYSAKANVKN